MDTEDGGGGSSSSGSRVGLSEYIDPNASSLLGRVDFVGMVRDWIRTIVFLVSLSWASFVIGAGRAFTSILDAIKGAYFAVYSELLTGPARAQSAAAEAAGSELEVFGILALPVGTAVALSAALAFVVVVYTFTGGELF